MFGTATKKDKVEDSPGPGNYEPKFSKIQTRSREAMIIQTNADDRHSYIKGGKSPGPGHYLELGDPRAMQNTSTRGASGKGGGFNREDRTTEFDNVI